MKREIEPFLIQVAKLKPTGAVWQLVSAHISDLYNAKKDSGKYRIDIPDTHWDDLKVPKFK